MADKQDNYRQSRESTIKRRAVLHGVGAVGVAGVLGAGTAAGNNGRGRGQEETGNPQEECECPAGTVAWGKYDFDTETCEFYLSEGTDVVTITYDPDAPAQNKEDEECEPIQVDYAAEEGYVVTQICSFGGTDNHVDESPDGSTYVSDLTNPGGQTAAISNITFCVAEDDELNGEEIPFPQFQVDFVCGDPLPVLHGAENLTYSAENRLLVWKHGNFVGEVVDSGGDRTDSAVCADYIENSSAEISWDIDAGTSSVSFTLANIDDGEEVTLSYTSYGSDTDGWCEDEEQDLWDANTVTYGPDDSGEGKTLEIDLPPLDEEAELRDCEEFAE